MPAWLAPLLAAPFVGSFLGVLIRRLPSRQPVALARSVCSTCGHRLGPAELVPFASFLLQRGRCRACRQPIGWFHPGIEAAALAVAASALLAPDDGARLWPGCLLGWTLLALAWIDWEHFLLPDLLTLPLLLAGLGVAIARGDATEAALGAAFGYLGLRAVALLYRALRGRDGLGGGDAKLLAAAGAWLGAAALPGVVFWAAVFGLTLALLRRPGPLTATLAVPFGPALALAIWLAWLWPRLVLLAA